MPVTTEIRSDAGLASSLRLSVMRLSRRLRHERNSDDLSLNQLAVLGTLTRCGPLTVGELAVNERVKPPSMTRTVACLADAGLVDRKPHAVDGRQVVVHLTPAAERVIVEDRKRRDAWLARLLTDLDPESRDVLRRAAPLLEALSST